MFHQGLFTKFLIFLWENNSNRDSAVLNSDNKAIKDQWMSIIYT